VFLTQLRQAVVAVVAWSQYFPAKQLVHADAEEAYLPRPHVEQAERPATVAAVPVEHSRHAVLAVVAWSQYVPAKQLVHTDAEEAYLPRPHVEQVVSPGEVAAVPGLQSVQTVTPVALFVEYFPI
jgi:hypothetical protein